jgi:hypothetical protein
MLNCYRNLAEGTSVRSVSRLKHGGILKSKCILCAWSTKREY